jgi:hypothetical protein
MKNKNKDTPLTSSEATQPTQKLTLPPVEESQQGILKKDKKIPKAVIYSLGLIIILVLGAIGFCFFQKEVAKKPKFIPFPTVAPTKNDDFVWSLNITLTQKDKWINPVNLEHNQIQQVYKSFADILGVKNVKLDKYNKTEENDYTGFSILLTDEGKQLIPNDIEEHKIFGEKIGYHLTYREFKYIRKIVGPIDEKDIYTCENDDDCIVVAAKCCSCSMGGSSSTINIKYREYWESKKKEMCKDVACPAVYACPPGEIPQCVNNKCKLVIK